MPLRQDVPELVEHYKNHKKYLSTNGQMLEIYEGELLKYMEQELAEAFHPQAFDAMKDRLAPINVLQRIVDKQSTIYQQTPVRTVEDGSDSDSEVVDWYEKKLRANTVWNQANEFLNLTKGCLVEPFVYKNTPQMRAIKPDRFLPYSKDPVDETRPTHIITIAGTMKDERGESVILHAYTDDEFLIFNDREEILTERMAQINNPEGINPYGRIPFIYTKKSLNYLIPKHDSDTLRMTLLIPILVSDMNYAHKFQAFSIFYGIDLDDENLSMAPNAFWRLKSDKASETKPEIGTIKPQVDIEQSIKLIQSQLAFWLQTRGIRPGAVGQLTSENFASGISKMIDEMDTSEGRQKQVKIFEEAEESFWDLVLNHMHPVWSRNGMIESREQFTKNAKVMTRFAEQLPLVRRKEVIDEQRAEVQAGFTTKRRAIMKLNPQMTEDEVDALIREIDEEKTQASQRMAESMGGNQGDEQEGEAS